MGIYRKYNGSFTSELDDVSSKGLIIDSEINKLEYIINGITSSWKDRTTSDFISKANSSIEEIKKIEVSSMEEIDDALAKIHSVLDRYKAAS